MIPLDEALTQILADASVHRAEEVVPLTRALDRVLARDVVSGIDVPPWDNSAMDGYAVRSADVQQPGVSLSVVQRIVAGAGGVPLVGGAAARIFTGAPLPPGADAVLMQEDARLQGSRILCVRAVAPGENVRPRAQDISAANVVLPQGRRIRPQELGVLASIGVAVVSVRPRLTVGIVSTGSELQEPGEPLARNKIYNSNRYTLMGLLQAGGMTWRDYGLVPDNQASTERVFEQAAQQCDVILSSGGVSVGEEDHVRAAVSALGELKVWNLAIKPGKPLAYGRVLGTPFFGLPGNPASTFVTYGVIVKPYLHCLAGCEAGGPLTLAVRAGFSWEHAGRRREYLRGKLVRDQHGDSLVNLFDNQSSGILSLISDADCLVIKPIGQTCKSGDLVEVIPMSEWLTY